jgi:hypothetical protein
MSARELINVTKTLEVSALRKAFLVILPGCSADHINRYAYFNGNCLAWL